jgi:hypothetical protein
MNWIGYWLGKFFHWFLKADAVVKAPSNTTNSLIEWLKRNRSALAVRAAIGAGCFYIWVHNPEMLTALVRKCSTLLTEDGMMGIVRSSLATVTIPLNFVTAAAFGYVIDSVLDKLCAKFPFLREYIPAVNGNTVVLNQSDIPIKPKADEAGAGK